MGSIAPAAGISLALAIILSPIAGLIARRIGALSRPRPDRLSARPTPLLGGMVIVLAAFVPLVSFHERTAELWGLLGGGIVVFLVGLLDDLKGLSPAEKLVGQVVAACTLIAIEATLGAYGWGIHTVPLFILWLVSITNAFNLLDNMDGLAGGVAAITAGVIFLYSAGGEAAHVPLGAACFGAAALGFVAFNLPPARIFLGDNGSLLLGLVLASLAAKAGGGVGLRGWILPVLLLGVPLFDTIFVVANRTRAGAPITRGGKDHLSHRLLDFGLSSRKALLVLYLLSAGIGAVILILGREHPLPLLVAGAVVAMVLLGIGGLLSRPTLGLESARSRTGTLVLLDIAVFSVAFLGAYLIRFDGSIPVQYTGVVTRSIPIFLGAKFVTFAAAGLYREEVIRGPRGALRILLGCVIGSLIAVAIATMAWRFEDYSRAVFLIDGMITFILALGARYASRLAREALVGVGGRDLRIAVVATGEALRLLGPALASRVERKGEIVGAIRVGDDEGGPSGLEDLGPATDTAAAAREHDVRIVWIVGFGMPEGELDRVREECLRAGLVVREVYLRPEP